MNMDLDTIKALDRPRNEAGSKQQALFTALTSMQELVLLAKSNVHLVVICPFAILSCQVYLF